MIGGKYSGSGGGDNSCVAWLAGRNDMASWIVHLRIADMLIDSMNVDEEKFIAGNIAPDCGKRLPEGGFSPDKGVTHFTEKGKGECDYCGFFERYVRNEPDFGRRSFYLGYFVHLMTDVLWVRLINEPTKAGFAQLYSSDRNEYYRLVKKDWYDLDFLFLQKNPDFRAWEIFRGITDFPNEYLDFYGSDNMSVQFAEIVKFYTYGSAEEDREYVYLSYEQAAEFVNEAAGEIYKKYMNLTKERD